MHSVAPFPTVQLGELVEVLDSMRVPVNAEERAKRIGNIPYYGANGQQGWIDRALFDEPLILAAEDGGNFDEFATRPIAYRVDGPSWVNNHAHILRAMEGTDQSFVFWSLVHKDIRRYIAGGTRAKLTQGELRSIDMRRPPLPEQRHIAAILDTLDDAIRKTEQIIAKLKQVRQGLLHDLLTRGIDDNGELRDPERHPEQFKDSALGRVPRGWAIRRLDGAADVIDPNPSHRNPVYVEWGLPFISTVEFIEPDGVETNTPRRVAVVTVEEQERRCSFRPGSVAFSRKGTIGATRFLPTSTRFALLDSLCVMNAREGVAPRFLIETLRSRPLRRQLTNVTMGVALPQVSIGRVRSLLVPVPPREEQDALSDSLEAAAVRFQSEWEAGTKLRSFKAGLMEDLLTGRVRVTPLLQDATA